MIQAAFGKALPRQAQATFDFQSLLNRPVQLTIEIKQGAETEYSKVVDYAYVRNPETVEPLTREVIYFDMEAPDWTAYHNLSTWMKDRINIPEKLKKYLQPSNYPENREPQPAPAPEPEPDGIPQDDIPF